MKNKRLLLIIILLVPAVSFCQGSDDTDGVLEIINVTDPMVTPGTLTVIRSFNGASDSYDSYLDILLSDMTIFYPTSFIYSAIPELNLVIDERPADDTNDIFNLKLCLWASGGRDNYLLVNFYQEDMNKIPFGDKQVVLFSDRLKYGYAVDVKMAIKYGGEYPAIQLEHIPGGIYYFDSPYGTATLKIGRNMIWVIDIVRDGILDTKDFCVMAEEWMKSQGKYKADISGINYVPDGFVDCYDLLALAEYWLENSSDLNSDGNVDSKDYAILANNWRQIGLDYSDVKYLVNSWIR